VAQLNVSRSAPLSSVATLTWSAATGATSYNVYRGASANLGDLACFLPGVTGLTHNDDGALPVGAFYYLVTSKACTESGLGPASPSPRPAPPGCP
jgi:fibronectin type 3 domain-containing protein